MQSDLTGKQTGQINGSNDQQRATMFEARPATASSTSSVNSTKPLVRTSKEDTIFRCAIKGAIPIGFIGFSVIIIGVVQVSLEADVYAIGISLVGLGAVTFAASICLCVVAAYLATKQSPAYHKSWSSARRNASGPAPDSSNSSLPMA